MSEVLPYKLFAALLDKKEIKYTPYPEDNQIVVHWTLENNAQITILISFDDDGQSVALRGGNYCAFPEDKIPAMLLAANTLNSNYRWVKFVVDMDEKNIMVEDDAVIDAETCAEEVEELMHRMVNIAEESYKVFMKAIWSD